MKQMTFGTYIRFLRTRAGMTQASLADLLGVTDKAVSKWERDISCPDISLLPRLSDALGVTVDDLLNESLDSERPSRLARILKMSHDIRTPLHIILGCARMAEAHTDDTERLLRYLENIRIAGEYLLRSVDRVMATAASEPGESRQGDAAPGNGAAETIRELDRLLRAPAGTREDAALFYRFTGKRILVAEDIELNREIAGEILKKTGALAEFAEDGATCVRMVEEAPAGWYDLILMDIMMPNMDGIEAARQIRQLQDKEKAAVPIIALSANVSEKDREHAAEAGMDGFAEKPIFAESLFEMMKRCME